MAKTKRLDCLPEAEVTSLSYFMYHDVTDEEKMAFLQEKIGWNRPEEHCSASGLLGASYCGEMQH